ncbi:hypothetical protein [Shimia sp. SDUM112013]|uniref:hypothetical protein n=1 Tax=Shimia sp. SDUM112013 TaxID=3136160 RepID=UPI0032EE65E7
MITNGAYLVSKAELSSAEIERACDLPQTLLRSWRSRGCAPKNTGGTRYSCSLEDAAKLLLLSSGSKLGISPIEITPLLDRRPQTLVYFALMGCDGACEFRGPRKKVENVVARFNDSDQLPFQFSLADDVSRFMVYHGKGRFEVVSDLQAMLEAESASQFAVIDLMVLGRKFAEELGRPILTVVLPSDGDEAEIRRLSNGRPPLTIL